MTGDEDKIFAITELAEYLKIPKSTLYKRVRTGSVPCVKIGKHWRFHKDAIDAWLKQTDQGNSDQGNSDQGNNTGGARA
jgi:excisionase family DNA binding protein